MSAPVHGFVRRRRVWLTRSLPSKRSSFLLLAVDNPLNSFFLDRVFIDSNSATFIAGFPFGTLGGSVERPHTVFLELAYGLAHTSVLVKEPPHTLLCLGINANHRNVRQRTTFHSSLNEFSFDRPLVGVFVLFIVGSRPYAANHKFRERLKCGLAIFCSDFTLSYCGGLSQCDKDERGKQCSSHFWSP